VSKALTPNPQFDMLIAYGEARERAFRRVMTDASVEVVSVEHKSEPHALEHGAIFVEYADHGVPTGISITTADYYAVEIATDRWFVLPTTQLLALCEAAGTKTKGGWEGRSEGYRLPVVRLLRP
jgi:hypothetical protein